jgi:hypothetical protein
MPKRKVQVFVSHSSKDKSIVDRIVSDLKNHGISVWYDKFEIKAGDNIVEKVNEGLRDSKYFLIILSPNAICSSWVTEEMSFAVLQQIALKDIFVIPVLIEDCNIPPLLQHKRYVDFRNSYDQGIQQLLEVFMADHKVLENLSRERVSPWPDISQADKEYIYLYSTRFDKVFKLPCSLNSSASELIDYMVETLKLPWNKDIPELGMRWSFSYAILHNDRAIPLSKSLGDAGVSVGDTTYLRINGTYEDLWEKELREMWDGRKIYEVTSAMMRDAKLRQLIQQRGRVTEKRLKEIADGCFDHV